MNQASAASGSTPGTQPPLTNSAASDLEMHATVRATQVQMIYARLRTSVLMTLAVTVIFSALLLPFFPRRQMLFWVAAGVTVALARYALWSAYTHAQPTGAALKRWDSWFLIGTGAAGLVWSLGPLMLMPPAGQAQSMLLMGTVLCIAAVSAVTQAPRLPAMMLFQGTTLLPTSVALFLTGGAVELYAAWIVLAGFISLIVVGRVLNASIRTSIESEIRLSRSVQEITIERERAHSASLAKTRFLANMSHELRTPLNAVIGAAQLLRSDTRDEASQRQLVDAIQTSGTNLLGLIENILDLSRIEAGELQLASEDFQLMDCIASVMATAKLTAQAKGLALNCTIEPDVAPWRHGDLNRVRQIVLNLLGNALKFTPSGSVHLRVQRSQVEPEHSLHISVRDTGVGIGAASLPHVFEPFRQADDGANRRFGGSGLGLSIVHQLVQAMGGSISVHSELGQGTRFDIELRLPLAQAVPASTPSTPALERDKPDAQVRILVVEDDPLNQTIVCRLLQHRGYASTAADSGAQALALMQELDFDLVLMDWQMPAMDGLEVTRRLRAGASGARGQTVPIVALTANAFAEDRATCLAAGMNDFLTKPVLPERLLAAVQRWTQAGPRERQA